MFEIDSTAHDGFCWRAAGSGGGGCMMMDCECNVLSMPVYAMCCQKMMWLLVWDDEDD